MQLKYILTASALAIGLCAAGPAMSQTTANGRGDDTVTTSNGDDGNVTRSHNDNSQGKGDDGNTDVRDSLNGNDLSQGKGDDNNDNSRTRLDHNVVVVSSQTLRANNSAHGMDSVVHMNGKQERSFKTGDNSINDGALQAFAGILTQSFNTGLVANAQAGTNIAAQGTVNIGTR